MSIIYFTHALGIIHLIRFFCLIILLIFAEIKIPSCGSYLNEFFGFNYQSILFYYILIWISFTFEIYFFINRLFGTPLIQAKISIQILFSCLTICFILGGIFTLIAMINLSYGYLITPNDFDLIQQKTYLIVNQNCNTFRLIGIIFGFTIGIFYAIPVILIYRNTN